MAVLREWIVLALSDGAEGLLKAGVVVETLVEEADARQAALLQAFVEARD